MQRHKIRHPLVVVVASMVALAAPAGAATNTATYLDAEATITVPDAIAPGTPFDVEVQGRLIGFGSFSVHSYRLYRDAVWAYTAAHLVSVSSGHLIQADGISFGNLHSSSHPQTLAAGSYSYTFIFGQRSFGHGWYDVAVDIQVTVGAALRVEIDLKPGREDNPVRPRAGGVVPVAVLTTNTGEGESTDFDAWEADPLTLALGPGEAGIAHANGHAEDVDGDGDLDMVVHFRIRETGLECGDSEVTLTGETRDGEGIEGSDAIRTVGCEPAATRLPRGGAAPHDPFDRRDRRPGRRGGLRPAPPPAPR